MNRLALTAALTMTALLASFSIAAAAEVTVELSLDRSSIDVGTDVTATVTVQNTGDTPTDDLAVHIDVTDPTMEGSVDPEDWTETLTLPLGVLAPGDSAQLRWDLTPISGGRFSIYAVALSTAGSDRGALSSIAVLDVAEKRAINPQGVLPVVLGVPLLLGSALITTTRRRR